MNAVKYIIGILILIICLGLVGAAVWYCLFELPDQAVEQGTLVFRAFTGRAAA